MSPFSPFFLNLLINQQKVASVQGIFLLSKSPRRYTSNDAPRAHARCGRGRRRPALRTYLSMRGQGAWPASWPARLYFHSDLARFSSLGSSPGRGVLVAHSLALPPPHAVVVGVEFSLTSSCDLILIAILLFLSSEPQLQPLRKRSSWFTFHPLVFYFVSSLSLSLCQVCVIYIYVRTFIWACINILIMYINIF